MPEYIMSFDLDENGKLINARRMKELVRCGECVKHNIEPGMFIRENGVLRIPYKTECCPLVSFRGKANGHEFDYQYCVYGKRKED